MANRYSNLSEDQVLTRFITVKYILAHNISFISTCILVHNNITIFAGSMKTALKAFSIHTKEAEMFDAEHHPECIVGARCKHVLLNNIQHHQRKWFCGKILG